MLIAQSVFQLESENQNISDQCTPKTGIQTDPNFKTNQALVVPNHTVKFQIDQSVLKFSETMLTDGRTNWTHQFNGQVGYMQPT